MKKLVYLCLFFLTCLGLSACSIRSGETAEKKDEGHSEMIRVYDADEKKILETKDEEVLDTFGEYVGSAGENVEGPEVFADMPADAKVAYHFVLTTRDGYDIDMYVYENDHHLLMKDIPLVGNLKLPVSEKELDWLRHPEKW